jgi:hemoglobin
MSRTVVQNEASDGAGGRGSPRASSPTPGARAHKTPALYQLRNCAGVILALFILATTGCGGGPAQKKKEDFFTSGSREADQRASQRMARDEQLTGAGEGAGEKDVKKAKPGEETAAQVPTKQSLFERLGAEKGIAAIIEDFTPRALEDPRVNWQRKGVTSGGVLRRDRSVTWNASQQNIDRLKKHMVQFLSLATGGPSNYEGKQMKGTHAAMKITNAEFDAVIGDLKATLDKLRIPNQEQKELLAIIESTRPQIVTER